MMNGATISKCGKYRYALTRYWGGGPMACFIMLNPSTADASVDDPTIRRCIGFAKREGCGSLVVVNLYALRSTDPTALANHPHPTGPEWRGHLDAAIAHTDGPIIAAWGAHPGTSRQATTVLDVLTDAGRAAFCLGKTKDGSPRHPLYVKGDAPLQNFWIGVQHDAPERGC